jgi:hypothetical protein
MSPRPPIRFAPRPLLVSRPLLTSCVLALAACGGADSTRGSTEWRAQIDTVGDTVVVRTLEGSEWGAARLVPELRIGVLDGAEHEMLGEVVGLAVDRDGNIYFYDRLVPALRRYGPDGTYLGTLGGQGGGPGEYANSDGGLVTLADGRVVLRDPGNGRFTVFGPDGSFVEGWPTAGGAFTSIPLFPTADGTGFYSYAFAGGARGLARYGEGGAARDTLTLPEPDMERRTITARSNGSSQTWNVPFAPTALWSFHPDGYFVSAVSDRYAVDLLRGADGVLRIEKEAVPVPVSREEREAEEDRVTRAMRNLDPSWRWDGPPIPSTKPTLRAVHAAEDGRIWGQLHQPGERIPDEELDPVPDGAPPPPRFREPVVFDVFEDDGRYLGRVEAPGDLGTFPRPVMRGEHVWAVVRDQLGVQSVVRYRLESGGVGSSP